jgi:3',5'-cyclic AMP phosphodiesterase CpdA
VLVAHFSDLHLLSLEGARIHHFLGKRATGGVNLLFNRGGQFPVAVARALVADVGEQAVDHVVVSGDLTNLAFPAEFRLVRSILEQLPLPPSEVTVVPGNHDYYTRDSAAHDHFGRAMAGFSTEAGLFPLLQVNGDLAVVALNSAHPSLPLMAYGTLGKRQLREARSLLAAPEHRDRFRLVVLHHPPHREHVRWHNRLTDLRAFVSMIREVGAELIVHGHLHRPVRATIAGRDGEVPVIGVASGTWLSPDDPSRRAQYNLYSTSGRQLVDVTTRRYDPVSGRFGPV